ncbi:MAG TPA: shikimate dehydrogenase, partial [Anseongella sp.]|nr:shikimate dehydrogenase [Anseongella sp.]
DSVFVSRRAAGKAITYGEVDGSVIYDYPLIINCTPLGPWPDVDQCPGIPYAELSERNLLFDLVYNPEETLFLKKGRERGAVTKNGLEMLRLQAEKSWEIWTSEA